MEKKHREREQIYLDFLQNTGDVQIDQKEKKKPRRVKYEFIIIIL